ncbi:MAG: hypothetical protein HFF90_12895 [Oscillibacter sp.]|nr:hypothetical protein [Oscillibacter sp.]
MDAFMDYGIAMGAIIGEQKHCWGNNDRLGRDVNRDNFTLITVIHLGVGVIKEKLTENCAVLLDGAGHNL